MATLNGIGTRFYGISSPDANGKSTATLWITFLYFPIAPVKRVTLIRAITDPRIFSYTLVQNEKLNWKEILTTWLWGWIITPVLWFSPVILSIREVAAAIGVPTEGENHGLWTGMMIFSILWLIVFAWKWKDWLDKQGLPKNYKELIKAKTQVSANRK